MTLRRHGCPLTEPRTSGRPKQGQRALRGLASVRKVFQASKWVCKGRQAGVASVGRASVWESEGRSSVGEGRACANKLRQRQEDPASRTDDRQGISGEPAGVEEAGRAASGPGRCREVGRSLRRESVMDTRRASGKTAGHPGPNENRRGRKRIVKDGQALLRPDECQGVGERW